jgi:hypothetical protein
LRRVVFVIPCSENETGRVVHPAGDVDGESSVSY